MSNDYKEKMKETLRYQAFDKIRAVRSGAVGANRKTVREAIYRGIDMNQSDEDMVKELRDQLFEEEFGEER